MACIPPNPRRVGYIIPIHGLLDGPLYIGSHIHQHFYLLGIVLVRFAMGLHLAPFRLCCPPQLSRYASPSRSSINIPGFGYVSPFPT